MNLRAQAAADMRAILEDSAAGFATLATVTSPEEDVKTLNGIYREVDEPIVLETGQLVASRKASIVFSVVTLAASGMSDIRNIPDEDSLPWVIQLADMGGNVRTYKVTDTPTDELGAVTCMLEAYRPI